MMGLWIVVMLDYILTYIGVTIGIVYEANPFMVWLFEMDLWAGLMIRAVMATVLVGMFYYIKQKTEKAYTRLLVFFYVVNAVVMGFHLYWISYL